MKVLAIALAMSLAGCAGIDDVARLRQAQPRGSNFSETLAREYRAYALRRSGAGNWPVAGHFATKGLAALAGQMPEPEPVDPDLPEAVQGELTHGRVRLLDAMRRRAAERYPAFAAVALARFDCWADRERAWIRCGEAQRCRQEFDENVTTIEEALSRAAGGT